MRIRFWLAVALIAAATVPAVASRRSDAKTEVDFGITCAQKDMWPRAVQQFTKATEIDPTYAAAWNNLAVGYEQLGQFTEARKAYEKAMFLDHSNQFIRNNYDQFRDIYDRQNRRRDH